jgi:dihydrodipicolinate synthase/N-acetylneuraminate lyase
VCVELFETAKNHDIERALELYKTLHPLLRWDSSPRFVQAIKLSMDLVGRPAGGCQPPRGPLTPDEEHVVKTATEAARAAGLS